MTGLDSETRSRVARTLEHFVAEHYAPAQRLVRLPAQPPDYRAQSAAASTRKRSRCMGDFRRDVLKQHSACYDAPLRGDGAGLQATKAWVRAATINDQFLYGRRWSLFGGSNEIQRNRIAAQLLRG